jgi:lipid A ethanolaminephosphotransferase
VKAAPLRLDSARADPSSGALRTLAVAAGRAWSAPRSAQAVVLVLAAWLALAGNLALWRSVLPLEPGRGGALVCLGIAVLLSATLAALLAPTAWGGRNKPVWLAVLLVAAVAQHFMLDYGTVLDTTMIGNVVETDLAEATDLLGWGLLGPVLLVVGPPALWLVPLPVQRLALRRTALRIALLFAASLAVALAATSATYPVLAPLVRNHMELRFLPNPIVPIWSAARVASRRLWSRPKALVPISAGAALGTSHAASARPPLLVLVVGETARADHFALNGYPRDTTPELAARGVLSFRRVRSCGTSTLASVPCMFSALGKAGFESRQADQENLLDVVQAAGMAVLWIDNQAGCKGVCDRVASASTVELAGSPAGARLCADGECLDEALLVGLDARLAALPPERRDQGVLLVLHQMGSHGPAYARRSPAAYKRFAPECRTTTLGDCAPGELVNAYDDSIAYTDHVLAATIDWARAQKAYAPALLYVSDHGESLGEHGVFLHGLPYPFAPEAQKHVAMVAWLGDAAAARDRLDPACLRRRLDQPLSHDHLYHSVLGLLDVTTPTYDRRLDIWSPCKRRDEG